MSIPTMLFASWRYFRAKFNLDDHQKCSRTYCARGPALTLFHRCMPREKIRAEKATSETTAVLNGFSLWETLA